ncbi:MAG TPA: gamma-glutamyl-gamma-aminobutyrate hydrolase family protein [Solirubrobacteraceae bacterium]|nr:gamma-glutamyl-gamma-aminobutyrate hydrolase family protein [Solirubrobacteraceae bacterium]
MRAPVIVHDPGGLAGDWLSGRGAEAGQIRIATDAGDPDPRGSWELATSSTANSSIRTIGVADLNPATSGGPRDPATDSTYPARDEFELAICRGMQILNVAFGGTLEQNLVAAGASHPYREVVGRFDGNEYTVDLEPGSLAAEAVGEQV